MERDRELFLKLRAKKIIAVIGGAALVVLLASAFDAITAWGKVHPGVLVEGVDIGGMSKSDARELLERTIGDRLNKPIIFTYKSKVWKVSTKKIGLKVNYERTVDEAYSVGRKGGIFESIGERAAAWLGAKRIGAAIMIDETATLMALEPIENEIGQKASDALVRFEGLIPRIVSAKSGYGIDRPKAIADVKKAAVDMIDRKVSLKLVPVKPDITDEQAAKAAREAARIVSEPLVLAYGEMKWTLKPENLVEMVTFKKEPEGEGHSFRAGLDKSAFAAKVSEMTAEVNVELKDARFEIFGDTVSVIPGKNGRKIDVESAYESAVKALANGERKLYMSVVEVEPELTTEEAKSYGIEKKLASYTTYYNPSAAARVSNIHLIADAIDGAIVAPGEIFSVNERVGPRTADKGYKEAPVIINGRLEPGIGGGICQAVTTLFDAVFFAGLDIVERSNHAFYISRYPAGLDATVSYGSLDLKFKNDTGYHILIKFWYTADSVTAAIYGKDGLGTEVIYSTTPFTNYRGFTTTVIEDPELPKGTRIVEQEGVMGRDITAYRTVKRNGKVVHQDEFFSRYDPEPAIVRIGTKEVPQPTTASTETAAN